MAQTFISWDVDQVVLLPPSIQELVPVGHLAHVVRALVRESEDLYRGPWVSALCSHHAGCLAAVGLLPGALRVTADRQGL
jgi:hypothetical protein